MVRIYKYTKKGSKLFVRMYLDEEMENTQENKESIASYFITAREMFVLNVIILLISRLKE